MCNRSPDPPTSPAARRASWLAVLAAPWLALVSPRRAGEKTRHAGVLRVSACYLLMVLVLSGVLTLLSAWSQTVAIDYAVMYPPSTQPALAAPRSPWVASPTATPEERSSEDVLLRRTFGQVISDWNNMGYSWLIAAVLSTAVLTMLFSLLASICLIARTYSGGCISDTIKTSMKAPWLCLGWVAVIIAVLGAAMVVAGNAHELWLARQWANGVTWYEPDAQRGSAWWSLVDVGPWIATPLAAWALICLAELTAAGTTGPTPPETGPRCTGCGYSLQHVPADGRCPECSLSTEDSLSPATRPGLAWDVRRSNPVARFLQTAAEVLRYPTKAYGAVLTRGTEARSWRFERIVLLIVTVMAVTVAPLLAVSWRRFPFVFVPGPAGTLSPMLAATFVLWLMFLAWVVHRAVGAVAVCVAAAREPGADAAALARIVGYESVFLCVLFVFNVVAGVLLSDRIVYQVLVYVLEDLGFSAVGAARWVLRIVPLGNAALVMCWFLRYRRAYRAVRWANF